MYAVDSKHQIIVHAEAYGAGQEQHTLEPMLLGIQHQFKQFSNDQYILQQSRITADSGFHSEANMKMIYRLGIDGYIADNQFRKRDPRFAESITFNKAKAQRGKERGGQVAKRFTPADFDYDSVTETCRCPAGKPMWKRFKGQIAEQETISFQGYREHCRDCALKHQCLRRENQPDGRQVSFTLGDGKKTLGFIEKMKQKIDSPMGRHIYSQRLRTVEPVFGNLECNKGLNRFTLRGRTKVNAQWLMYYLVHNIEKIATQGQPRH